MAVACAGGVVGGLAALALAALVAFFVTKRRKAQKPKDVLLTVRPLWALLAHGSSLQLTWQGITNTLQHARMHVPCLFCL